MKTFISIGNSDFKFDRLINSIIDKLEYLPKPILYQYGHSRKISGDISNFNQIKFLSLSDYYSILKGTKFFVSHLGAGSLINSNKFKINTIFLSRKKKFNEHVDDHQYELYNYLKKYKNYQNIFSDETEFASNIIKISKQKKQLNIHSQHSEFENLIDKILKN